MRKKDDPIDFLFNFQNTNGLETSLYEQLNTTLPQGPEYDSNKLQIVVKIIDDFDGALEYLIQNSVNVTPQAKSNDDILYSDTTSVTNKKLYAGSLIDSSQIIFFISTAMNSECLADKNNFVQSGKLNF